MSAIATAVVVGGVASSLISSNATSNAANAQTNAANQANATTWGMFNQNQQNLQPYMQAGNTATNALNAWNAPGGQGSQQFNYQDYLNSPAMAFQLQQGQQALDRSAAARGVALSGGQMQAQQQYGQGVANNYYQQAFNNFQQQQQQRFGQLYSMAGLGENAAAGVGNQGMNAAALTGQNTMNAANGAAAAQLANANMWTGTLNNGVNALANNYYMGQTPMYGGSQGDIWGGTTGNPTVDVTGTNWWGSGGATGINPLGTGSASVPNWTIGS